MVGHTLISLVMWSVLWSTSMLKQHVRVTPWHMSNVVVQAKRIADGDMIAFTVRRDLSEVRWHNGRTATLQVYSAANLVEKRTLEGEPADGWLVYSFTLPIDHMAHSRFSISEFQTGDGAVHIVGGGVSYEMRLGDFAVQIDDADRVDGPPLAPAAGETTLADAVRTFNSSAARPAGPDGAVLAPLTVEEVKAAIRWKHFDQEQMSLSENDFARFTHVAKTGVMLEGARFSLITLFRPNEKWEFRGWSVRLTMPLADAPGSTYDLVIREHWLGSREIGPLERAMRED